MNPRLHRAWVLVLFLALTNASARENSGPHIYSNVRYVEEGTRDLLGTELELKINGTEASGVLRIYQGGCAEPVQVTGSLSGSKIDVFGEGQGFGKIEITGNLHDKRLEGLLRLERTHSSEKIRLKRITKPHC